MADQAAAIIPITADSLAAEFGGKARVTRDGVQALYAAIRQAEHPAAETALAQWLALFRTTCGADWPRPSAKLDTLAKFYRIEQEGLRPEAVLFALHSWYALVVKLLAGHVMARVRGVESPAVRLARAGRAEIADLESGGTFARLKVTDPFCGGPFAWCAEAWSEAMETAAGSLAERIARLDAREIVGDQESCPLSRRPRVRGARARGDPESQDLLKPLYQGLFPRAVRHALGEFYTPDWLAEHVLDRVGYCGQPQQRLLDPSCGSGTFLVAAIRRLLAAGLLHISNVDGTGHHAGMVGVPIPAHGVCGLQCSTLLQQILRNVVGYDLHPLAVLTARANYLLAIAHLVPPDEPVDVPVFARDSILDGPATGGGAGPFDYVVGNPPWIAWDNLPDDYRQASKPLWEKYGLFSLSGNEARHGGGKKDLSMLMLYASADRYLRDGGRLGMVITQTLFQTKGAGDGFRRFRLGAAGPPLRVDRVDDFVAVRPFEDAANWTSTIALTKGVPTCYPVPYVKWSPGEPDTKGSRHTPCAVRQKPKALEVLWHHKAHGCGRVADGTPTMSTCCPVPATFGERSYLAEPIDGARPNSPWSVRSQAWTLNIARLVGPSDYSAHLGANSGGANGVYWLDVLGATEGGVRVRNLTKTSKQPVEAVEAVIEPDLLYPLLRWGDVDCYRAQPSAYLLLAQDPATRAGIAEATMRARYPRTFAYLQRFEPLLTDRAAYRRYQDRQPFYSMYNVGTYTIAPIKVVWRRMDRRIRAAVLEESNDPHVGRRAVIPQETCVLVECAAAEEAHYLCAMLNSAPAHFLVASHSVTGGKGFGTPSILDFLPLRRFDPANLRHVALAALGRAAGSAGQERRIDRLAAELLGISEKELAAILAG